MLVLSRRAGQKVIFPSLGVSIEVLRSRGSVTRLGIEAPEDVEVLRDELHRTPQAGPEGRDRRHALSNALNRVMLKLQLLQRKLELGQAGDSESQLNGILAECAALEQTTADRTVEDKRPRVLVIEDQANERELLASCLQLAGIDVLTAANGRIAFDLLHEHEPPDLVLLDMRMPEMDGPTFLQTIRDDVRLNSLRVFGLTGSSRCDFAPNLPINGWFSKPVRIDALLQALQLTEARQPLSA